MGANGAYWSAANAHYADSGWGLLGLGVALENGFGSPRFGAQQRANYTTKDLTIITSSEVVNRSRMWGM